MNWLLVDHASRVQPPKGSHTDWKEQIAEECSHQCVYCAIPESRLGGIDNFHIDHYRPKARFSHLSNDIRNLFLACPICNRFKGDDWPNEPLEDHSVPSYPDPSLYDYNDLMEVSQRSHRVRGLYAASEYLVHKLYLNRPQLIMERREDSLHTRIDAITRFVIEVLPKDGGNPSLPEWTDLLSRFVDLCERLSQLRCVRPYVLTDIRRPR